MKKSTPRTKRTPKHLARKLVLIREALGLTQGELIERIGLDVVQQFVSAWEKGIREPDLLNLMRYSKAANICVEVLIRDDLDLPEKLPAKRFYDPH